eukprot:scaffold232338_cov19-Tisochrysis_lutea.AAC.1
MIVWRITGRCGWKRAEYTLYPCVSAVQFMMVATEGSCPQYLSLILSRPKWWVSNILRASGRLRGANGIKGGAAAISDREGKLVGRDRIGGRGRVMDKAAGSNASLIDESTISRLPKQEAPSLNHHTDGRRSLSR